MSGAARRGMAKMAHLTAAGSPQAGVAYLAVLIVIAAMGVFSLAEGKPVKQANFPSELAREGGKSSYAEWQFVFVAVNPGIGAKN